MICLVGDSGLGKSRLVAEVIADMDPERVLQMRAEPYGANSPYRMLRDPLRGVAGIERSTASAMARTLRRWASKYAPDIVPWLPLLNPVLQLSLADTKQVKNLDPQFIPERTAEAVIRMIEAWSTGAIVMVIDDAHWADEASVELLGHIGRACKSHSWLMLANRREGETGFSFDEGRQLPIGPMPDADMRQLVAAISEAAPLNPQDIDTIVARAQGYPLFASELIRTYRELGSTDQLPESVESALASQVDLLDGPARQVLRFGAVLGQSFSTDMLVQLLASQGRQLEQAQLSRVEEFLVQDGSARLRFRNALLRDTIYEGLSYKLRRRLHRAAGRAIEHQADDPSRVADSLAMHFFAGGDYTRAVRYARVAAETAKAGYANGDAARLYSMAIDAVRRGGSASPKQVAKLWSDLGDVRNLAGYLEDSLTAYGRAMRVVGKDPLARADLLLQRAHALERAGAHPRSLRDIGKALKLLDRSRAAAARSLRARLLALRAIIFLAQNKSRKALVAAQEAEQAARRAGESYALARSLIVQEATTLELQGPGDGHFLREALELGEAEDDTAIRAMASTNLGVVHTLASRWDEAVKWFQRGRDLCLQTGNYLEAAFVATNLGEILVNQQRDKEAEGVLAEALRVMQASDFDEGMATIEIQLARLQILRGDFEQAERTAAAAADRFMMLGETLYALEAVIVRAEALSHVGRYRLALRCLDDSVQAAGGEAGYLLPKLCLARARARLSQGSSRLALEEIGNGLQAAEHWEMLYEKAQLLDLRSEIEANETRNADKKNAQRLYQELGVIS